MAKDKQKPDEDLSTSKGLQDILALLQSQINQKPLWVRKQYLMLIERLSKINQADLEDLPHIQASLIKELSAVQQTVDKQLKSSLEKMKEAVLHQRLDLLAKQSRELETKKDVSETKNVFSETPFYPVSYTSPWRRFLKLLFFVKHKKTIAKKEIVKPEKDNNNKSQFGLFASKKPSQIKAKKGKFKGSKVDFDQPKVKQTVKKAVKKTLDKPEPIIPSQKKKAPKKNIKVKQKHPLELIKTLFKIKRQMNENELNISPSINKKTNSKFKKDKQDFSIKKTSSSIQSKWLDLDALDKSKSATYEPKHQDKLKSSKPGPLNDN